MRLFEIISLEPKFSNRTNMDYEKAFRKSNASWLGSGSRGEVYDLKSPKRPNQVTKIGHGMDKAGTRVDNVIKDGYLAFIKTVYDFEQAGGNNPYFPKIYDLIVTQDKNNKISYRINIEKLSKFYSKNIDSDVLLIKFKQLFSVPPDYDEEDFGFFKSVTSSLLFGEMTGIRDPQFKQALEIIYKVIENGDFRPDIHSGNFMWRNVDNNPQLVIIDPID